MIQWTQLTLFWNEGLWTANKIIDALLLIAFIQRCSPLLSTPCALVACNSEQVPFTARFHIHPSGVLGPLCSCCIVGAMWNCCCLGTHSAYIIQPYAPAKCHFMQSHTLRCMFSCSLPPALLAEWPGSLHLYCSVYMSTRYLSTQRQNEEWVALLNATTILFDQYTAVTENKRKGRIKSTLINIKFNLNGERTMHHPHEIHTQGTYSM